MDDIMEQTESGVEPKTGSDKEIGEEPKERTGLKRSPAPKMGTDLKGGNNSSRKSGSGKKTGIDNASDRTEKSRYLIRILKGTALPILYVFVSFLMLRKYVLEYTGYYEYNILMIAAGSGLGLLCMSGLTVFNVFRASRKRKTGIEIKNTFIIGVYVPLILLILIIALVNGISSVWQFSMGFFFTAIIPPLIVLTVELSTRSKFFVKETEGPNSSLHLIFVPNGE
jgi:hypothetical protein